MTAWEARLNSGNFNEFDGLYADGTDLEVTAPGLVGTAYAMSITADGDSVAGWARLDIVMGANVLDMRLHLNPASLSMGTGNAFVISKILDDSGSNNFIDVTLGYDGASFELTLTAYNDAGSGSSTAAYNISSASHYFDISIARAASAVSGDGYASLSIDGALKETESSIDNYDLWGLVDAIKIGIVEGLDAATTGTLIVDELSAYDDGVSTSTSTTTGTSTSTTQSSSSTSTTTGLSTSTSTSSSTSTSTTTGTSTSTTTTLGPPGLIVIRAEIHVSGRIEIKG